MPEPSTRRRPRETVAIGTGSLEDGGFQGKMEAMLPKDTDHEDLARRFPTGIAPDGAHVDQRDSGVKDRVRSRMLRTDSARRSAPPSAKEASAE